jgi:hypothetical protein
MTTTVCPTAEDLWDLFDQLDADERIRFLEMVAREEPPGLPTVLLAARQESRLLRVETNLLHTQTHQLHQEANALRGKLRKKDPELIEKVKESYRIQLANPDLKMRAIASRVGLTERQLHTYRQRYASEAPRPAELPERRRREQPK